MVLNDELTLSTYHQSLSLAQCYFFYINELSEDLTKNARIYADNVSLFTVVITINFHQIIFGLSKINPMANQWSNQGLIFSRKIKKGHHILH